MVLVVHDGSVGHGVFFAAELELVNGAPGIPMHAAKESCTQDLNRHQR